MRDITLRILQINDAIYKSTLSIYHIKRMPIRNKRYYAVILKKNNDKAILDRVKSFYSLLNDIKNQNESLILKNRCFYLIGADYELVFCLEFYYKFPEKVGYIENGIPKIEFLYRMGTELASNKFSCFDNEKKAIVGLKMNDTAIIEKLPNPFDRFTFIVKKFDNKV